MENREALGELFRKARKAKGKSAAEVAAHLGYDRQSVYDLEKGRTAWNSVNLKKGAEYLGIPLRDAFSLAGIPVETLPIDESSQKVARIFSELPDFVQQVLLVQAEALEETYLRSPRERRPRPDFVPVDFDGEQTILMTVAARLERTEEDNLQLTAPGGIKPIDEEIQAHDQPTGNQLENSTPRRNNK